MLCAEIIEEMAEDNFLIETEKGRYKLNDKGQILTGTFQRKSNGKNLFIPDEGGEPIFVAERNSAHAMNNDKVKISLCAKRKRHELEGQVIEILQRAETNFVGTLKVSKLCIPADRNQHAGKRYFYSQGKAEGWKRWRQSSC